MRRFGIWFASAIALFAIASCDDEKGPGEADYAAQATVASSDAKFTASSDGGTVNFKTEGGYVLFAVSCGCDWTADNSAPDLFSTSTTPNSLTVTAEQNTVSDELKGVITFKTYNDGIVFATITIVQTAYNAPEITVETAEWNIPAVGVQPTEIAVEASDDWTAECADSWLTVTQTETGITLEAADNTLTEERSTKVTLTCTDGVSTTYEYVTVNQEALAYVTLSNGSVTFGPDGGSDSVSVESNYDWDYSYDTANGWFTVERDGDVLTVTVVTNEGIEIREGVVTITAGDGAENVTEAQLTAIQEGDAELMVLTYSISSDNTSTQLPLYGNVDCTVDWGDGSEVETVTKNLPPHTYEYAGDYDVKIRGTVSRLYSKDISTSKNGGLPITAVKQWGKTGLTNMTYALYYCQSLSSLPEYTGDAFAEVTDFSWAFADCKVLTTVPKGIFDSCTKCTTFADVFNTCFELKTIPDGLFDNCPEVTSFNQSFYSCIVLEAIPANLFRNCTKVTNFGSCFNTSHTDYHPLKGESAYDVQVIDGVETIIHLYERENYPDLYTTPTTTTSCYKYQRSLDDYSDIPNGWK